MDFSHCKDCLIVLSLDQSLDDKLNNHKLISNLSCNGKLMSAINNLPTVDDAFDSIFTIEQNFTDEQLNHILKLLKPKSNLIIIRTNKIDNLLFLIKSNGFIVEKNEPDFIVACKPEYEIGSSIDTKEIWSLTAEDLTEGDLIDDDDLLDEADKVKPKPEDLRVCATTKQKKACANCNCGLKEELEREEMEKIRANTQNLKSSCGNCYLGDAFRCDSCPYRGLPAFKPGEKVTINDSDDFQ